MYKLTLPEMILGGAFVVIICVVVVYLIGLGLSMNKRNK